MKSLTQKFYTWFLEQLLSSEETFHSPAHPASPKSGSANFHRTPEIDWLAFPSCIPALLDTKFGWGLLGFREEKKRIIQLQESVLLLAMVRADSGLASLHFRQQNYTNPSIYLLKSEFSTKGTSFGDSGKRNQAILLVLVVIKLFFSFFI